MIDTFNQNGSRANLIMSIKMVTTFFTHSSSGNEASMKGESGEYAFLFSKHAYIILLLSIYGFWIISEQFQKRIEFRESKVIKCC